MSPSAATMSSALPDVKIDQRLMQRLASSASSCSRPISGCLYGLPVSALSTDTDEDEAYLVRAATGKERSEEDELNAEMQQRRDLEVLTEVIPCGMDPLGVFFLQNDNADGEEDADDEDDEPDVHLIHSLIEQLPEAFLDATDPVVIFGRGSRPLRVFLHTEGNLEEVEYEALTSKDLDKECQVIRVRGQLSLVVAENELELQNGFKHLIEKVSCPYGTFRLCDSDVFFLHTWKTTQAKAGGGGWAGTDAFQEDEEECQVTNLTEQDKTVGDLWKYVKADDDEEEDDGFGVPGQDKGKKKNVKVEEKEVMNFRLLMKMSGEACTTKTLNCAPVVHYEKKQLSHVRIPLSIDALSLVRKTTKIPDLMEVLKGSVQRQIHEMGRCILSELKMRGTTSLPEIYHFKPEPLGHFCCIVYNKRGTCENFAEFRRHIHRLFFLPLDRPYIRRGNRYLFEDDQPKRGVLTNVHRGVNPKGGDGEVSLVQGTYSYHHYMQDKFDDNGWGCAYRSLQTLISWFRHQGYTNTVIPTHTQIQKCLVDIGDKPSSFIGSKQWIGSTEVGFVLETSCKVESRFINVNSGDEMATAARDLSQHFKTQGTPVMIGGGVLAHTILGVHLNEDSGETRWLILDPHFTGSDYNNQGKPNLTEMHKKGWVGWKGKDFWKKGAFYNMCLPQRPKQW